MTKMTSFLDHSIDPAMRLLIAAIQVNGAPGAFERSVSDMKLIRAFELARQHGIYALFYKVMRGQESALSINAIVERHTNAYLGNLGRNMQVTQKLLKLLNLLAKNGIQAIPFKGPVIAVQAYGDIGLRSFCDLDLLIQSKDFPQVYELMESTEYQSIKPMIARMKPVWRRTRRNFEFQGGNLFLDFHQQVTTGPRFLRLRINWDQLSGVELNGQTIPCLNIEDTILMLAMHGTHHGWNLLKYVADFSYLVARQKDEIDWQKLVRKARRMGVLRMVLIGMLLGRTFCGLEIPLMLNGGILRDKKLSARVTHFQAKVLEERKSGLIPQLAFPNALDSRWFKLRYLAYYLFNPTNLDVLAVRLPMVLYPLYFIIRPVRLLSNLARGRELT